MTDHASTATDGLCADLVLEGGGVKGLGLVGAVSGLYEHGYRFGGPARVAGTSAGAMVAALIAAGMPVPRMVEVMRELDLRRFRDGGNPLRQGLALVTGLGMHPGDYLRNWIAKELEELGVRTFGDLRIDDPDSDLPAERAYRLVVVVVSDITSGHMARLPWDYGRYGLDPDKQPVADAVRASASIPFFYRPVELRLPRDGEVAVHVDGGMLSNFPINLFDRADGRRPRWPTFGVKLSGRPAAGPWRATWSPVRNLADLGKALITTMANAHDRIYLDDPAVCARTVFVETLGVKATDFDLPPDRRRDLYERGRAGAAGFLAGWDFAANLARYRPTEQPTVADRQPTVAAAGVPALRI
jgi:NTE family protein